MTPEGMALALLIAGGATVAIGLGALGAYLEQRFSHLRELLADSIEARAFLGARLEEAIMLSHRATTEAAATRLTLDLDREERARATKARELVDRHAKNARLRRARARSSRRGGSE
jgi:hypothetical protein